MKFKFLLILIFLCIVFQLATGQTTYKYYDGFSTIKVTLNGCSDTTSCQSQDPDDGGLWHCVDSSCFHFSTTGPLVQNGVGKYALSYSGNFWKIQDGMLQRVEMKTGKCTLFDLHIDDFNWNTEFVVDEERGFVFFAQYKGNQDDVVRYDYRNQNFVIYRRTGFYVNGFYDFGADHIIIKTNQNDFLIHKDSFFLNRTVSSKYPCVNYAGEMYTTPETRFYPDKGLVKEEVIGHYNYPHFYRSQANWIYEWTPAFDTLWIQNRDQGVKKYIKLKKSDHIEFGDRAYYRAFSDVNTDGVIFQSSPQSLIRVKDGEVLDSILLKEPTFISELKSIYNDAYILTTERGIIYQSPDEVRAYDYTKSPDFSPQLGFQLDNNDSLWYGTLFGVAAKEVANFRLFSEHRTDQQLLRNEWEWRKNAGIRGILQIEIFDSDNWIARTYDGFYRFKDGVLTRIENPLGVKYVDWFVSNSVDCIYALDDDLIYKNEDGVWYVFADLDGKNIGRTARMNENIYFYHENGFYRISEDGNTELVFDGISRGFEVYRDSLVIYSIQHEKRFDAYKYYLKGPEDLVGTSKYFGGAPGNSFSFKYGAFTKKAMAMSVDNVFIEGAGNYDMGVLRNLEHGDNTRAYMGIQLKNGQWVFGTNRGLMFLNDSKLPIISPPIEEEPVFGLYPNPSTGRYTFSVEEDLLVDIYSVDGKKVLSTSIVKNEAALIDLSSHSKGVYILKTQNNQGDQRSYKLIKQ